MFLIRSVSGYTLVSGTCERKKGECAASEYMDPKRNICVSCRELEIGAASCNYDTGVSSWCAILQLLFSQRTYPCHIAQHLHLPEGRDRL